MNVVAFSGGKDSTAMALRMAELEEDFVLLFTPTGNELPELHDHIKQIVLTVDRPLIVPPNKTLVFWIAHHNALPNWRQRWCTRQIKIEPCVSWLKANPGSTLCVGLRADEETREGLYGDFASYRYPLREWGWGLKEVWAYIEERGVTIPRRTDCALCYGQRLSEWYSLWRLHPDKYAEGERYEAETGHTFRSPGRDTWPAALTDLRAAFESGRVPKGVALDGEDERGACRVCRF